MKKRRCCRECDIEHTSEVAKSLVIHHNQPIPDNTILLIYSAMTKGEGNAAGGLFGIAPVSF